MDLFTRVVIRGKVDERGELAAVTEEIARRGFKAPEDGKEAKLLREALLASEQDPTKIVPLEHRIERTPLTPGVTVEDVTAAEEEVNRPEAPAAPPTPEAVVSSAPSAPSSGELLQIRREVEGFMSNMTTVLGRLGMSL